MSATLVAHCGSEIVDRAALAACETPKATASWFPVPHIDVLATATLLLGRGGFAVQREQVALARDRRRMFATLDLESQLAPGVSLAVGLRNSVDQSLSLGFTAGNRVFVCDNLAFHSDLVVKRKHTRYGNDRFREAISLAVGRLESFKESEAQRIRRMQEIGCSDERAESLLLRAYESKVLSHRLLPLAIREWRNPTFAEFKPRNVWSLFNACTAAVGGRLKSNPQQYSDLTMRIGALLYPKEITVHAQDEEPGSQRDEADRAGGPDAA